MIAWFHNQPRGSLATDRCRHSGLVREAPVKNTVDTGSSSVSAIPIERMSGLIASLHSADRERPRWLRREKHALWYVLP